MKKAITLLVLLIVALLAGCEEGKIYYKGKLRPVSEVEEIIADQLEVENPDLDLEVSIFEESEN
ncbi:hypothetical protein [Parageobacillus thermoglucosidasius]|uniref:hypothetical protein n=1 Tax=Parageobacillus thermoglucosidasius TaxID=1426 RepID=UPI002E1ECC41|nr:hypothetical protein [Parageobacillus thermoglucosidasius]MED4946472.1 hypothetical protein [Parageobacillus thermoglucosidasius]MED4984033.1 hypothetical protein [Parageobacillus thermoglucosidasius]